MCVEGRWGKRPAYFGLEREEGTREVETEGHGVTWRVEAGTERLRIRERSNFLLFYFKWERSECDIDYNKVVSKKGERK